MILQLTPSWEFAVDYLRHIMDMVLEKFRAFAMEVLSPKFS